MLTWANSSSSTPGSPSAHSMSSRNDRNGVAGVESPYPFLFASPGDLAKVTEEVRRSMRERALEIVAVRDRLAVELDTRLTECAQALAFHFSRGARLFAFGNGGNAGDAPGGGQGSPGTPAGGAPPPPAPPPATPPP